MNKTRGKGIVEKKARRHEYGILCTKFRALPVNFSGCYSGHKRFINFCCINSNPLKNLLEKVTLSAAGLSQRYSQLIALTSLSKTCGPKTDKNNCIYLYFCPTLL